MASSADDTPAVESAEIRAWVEGVATWFMQQSGWPPIMGRTLAWLMVSDPPEQNAAQIAEAVRASRASLTGTLRLLTETRMIQAVTRSGDRSTYYRVSTDAWSALVRRRLESIASFVDITDEGLRLFPAGAPQAARLREAHQVFEWLTVEAEPLLKRWDAVRNGSLQDGTHEAGAEQGDHGA
ncbi:GbsR/MarR family transcriptional regulator [Streptomyces albireticuli]|uniref:GbsR/MarR family transcriptional regulator n=1 Tax=Streptomyces albireticuli TaxID=1940 RepID=UPI001B80E30A|nr:transcriptional regulator [Streptomyces albireticuli]MCD9141050.1 transcriptional regulator [Streptomyces albireticuli]MCD9160988.1 transcriptional regulator [Streptomyces albireticuli]MCD9190954.1 transcriptional regulator [Streptomyces albireticuli]